MRLKSIVTRYLLFEDNVSSPVKFELADPSVSDTTVWPLPDQEYVNVLENLTDDGEKDTPLLLTFKTYDPAVVGTVNLLTLDPSLYTRHRSVLVQPRMSR